MVLGERSCQLVTPTPFGFSDNDAHLIQAARAALLALGSSIPKVEFTHLDAGFEHFTKKGTALPEETVRCAHSFFISICSRTTRLDSDSSDLNAAF